MMTHTYKVTGMTCEGCEAKVQFLLQKVEGVTTVKLNRGKEEAEITMKQHVPTAALQEALKVYPKYHLYEKGHEMPVVVEEEQKNWLQTYKPVLLIFAYILGITILIQFSTGAFDWMEWMRHFMAGFFITFSFFKLLNISGFADSYAMYDVIAKRWRGYGFIYAFIELALGLAYLFNFNPIITNLVTLVLMSISLVGVLQSVLNKRKIKCACLGDVFDLPMSTITIIEDGLMILMSLVMLISLVSMN
jgi:copper chaperone CopZ